ncbi:MAG: peptidoglycan recognition family protein [Chthoniobacteraceae bacterium]
MSKKTKKPAALAAHDHDDGHGSSNPNAKPPIKQFVESPNHSSRNGTRIDMIVLHCTEGSLQGTIATFLNSGGRQVSAHYVIDRNGDIIQMVRDSDRANHCKGANQNSIGIEHVGTEDQAMASAQAGASAALIRWLLDQYDIPRARIYGHDFAPGYTGGGTSCPDKLFGAAHSQSVVTAWVNANV